jgi:hypothetical protein
MLNGAGDSAGDIEVGSDDLAGLANMTGSKARGFLIIYDFSLQADHQ